MFGKRNKYAERASLRTSTLLLVVISDDFAMYIPLSISIPNYVLIDPADRGANAPPSVVIVFSYFTLFCA